MVDSSFTLISGTFADEQGLLAEMDFFMTQTIGGWVQDTVISDTASDKNIAYYTEGSVINYYDRCWVRVRATADELRFTGLSEYAGGDVDGFGGDGGNTELQTGGAGGTYWIMANRDVVHVVIDRDSDSTTYHGGFGLFDTYYTRQEDPKPIYVFGQTAASQTFASAARLEAFGPQSWGLSQSALASGVSREYEAAHPALVVKGSPNPRSGEPKFIEPVFYTDESYGYYEVRGEVPGLYLCGGADYTHGALITVTGTRGTTAGKYFIHKHTDDLTWAIGPVTVSGEG